MDYVGEFLEMPSRLAPHAIQRTPEEGMVAL
jgi:hypothetical protein